MADGMPDGLVKQMDHLWQVAGTLVTRRTAAYLKCHFHTGGGHNRAASRPGVEQIGPEAQFPGQLGHSVAGGH